MVNTAGVEGSCDPRFEAVREAFLRNFRELDEVGAGVCIRTRDAVLVDLWGGHRDGERRVPWRRDTLTNAYSVGKGILAALVLALVERGDLDFDVPVSQSWPEFAAKGKDAVTLRMLLSHRAGLPAVRKRLPEGAMLDWERMCSELAAQAPYWTPGEQHGYHVNSFGYLVGELVRRATGMRVGAALREFVTGPIAAAEGHTAADGDYHWGLARSEHQRSADTCAPDAAVAFSGPEQWAQAFPPTGDAEHDEMVWHTYFNPSGLSGMGVVNSAPWRLAEIPSTNGHGTARAVSAIYQQLLPGARGVARPVSSKLIDEATRPASAGLDKVLGVDSQFGLGFQLLAPPRLEGTSPGSFGHLGRGGSLGFADREAGVAFGYVMNRPGPRWRNPRTQGLVTALYECLGA